MSNIIRASRQRRRLPMRAARVSRAALLLSLLAGGQAATAAAQGVDTPEEIVVTAQKTGEQKLSDVPLPITAFTGAALEASGAASMRDFLQTSPGLSMFKVNESNHNIQIRGVSSLFGDATVGYYLDDLPLSLVNLQFVPDVSPYDLDRVEVLRGPQGTLYGASAEGGVIRILTKNADPGEFEGKADVFYSQTEDGGSNYGVQSAVNIPLAKDKLAIRLIGGYRDMSGYLDNPLRGEKNINDAEVTTFRAKATFVPSSNLTVRASAWINRTDEGAFPQADDRLERSIPFDEEIRTDYDLYNLAAEYDFGGVRLYSATSQIDYDTHQEDASFGAFGAVFAADIGYKAFNEELRLSSDNDGPFNWTAGLFYLDAKHRQLTDAIFQATGITRRIADARKTSQQWAVFGEGHYALTDTLTLTAGLRYFEDEREQETLLPAVVSTLQLLGIDAERKAKFTSLAPRFNLAFEPNDDTLVYANVAKGFRSGVHQFDTAYLTPGLSFPDVAKEENLWSYEAGAKLTLADDLFVDTAAYYIDWKDLQQLTTVIVPIGGVPTPAGFFENVGKARAIGLDFNLAYTGIEGLNLQLGGNINDSEYRTDLPGISGISRGDRIAFVPKLTLSASAEYRHELSDGGPDAVLRSAVQYSSRRNDYAGTTFRSDPLTFWNMRAGVEGDSWGLFVTAENLLNEKGKVIDASSTPLDVRPRPRTIGLAGRVTF